MMPDSAWKRGKSGKNDFDINMTNCRGVVAVDGGSILIKKNALNVFYGKNGSGKTTIGKAPGRTEEWKEALPGVAGRGRDVRVRALEDDESADDDLEEDEPEWGGGFDAEEFDREFDEWWEVKKSEWN